MRQLLCYLSLWFLIHGAISCLVTEDTCEFWLEVNHQLTMMSGSVALFPANGNLYSYNVTNVNTAEPIKDSHVISADGWEKPRLVIAVNKSMPGPPIEVYEGQTVIVHVTNQMSSISITIHWHGLHQRGTPWMDGVAFITQCPILPGQSFTFKFKAYPKGTFWYHAHTGSQLSMGLFGPLIVRERTAPPVEEHIMMLQEWNHDFDADMIHQKMLYGNYDNRVKLLPTSSLDGANFSMFPFQSGLTNGRGRYYYQNGTHNQAPLTVFTVKHSKIYRFRVIGASSLYPFRVSIDDHPLKLVASDGDDLQPVVVESFIINPGERYDFEITANQPVQNYWIRAQTLEVNVMNHIAEAILRYEGAHAGEPTTSRKYCTKDDRCLVVNCPFSYYPEGEYTDCRHIGHLKAIKPNSTPGADRDQPEEIEDIFLNFAFPGTTWTPASVNGRTFLHPPVSALTQPQELNTNCSSEECGEDRVCRCTYSINLQHNKVYQMVFLNMGSGKGWGHPVHMHGHSFHVVKLGYPKYNQITGKVTEDNLDINCGGNPDREKSFCNFASWSNSSWGGNNIPGLELQSPIKKDTVMVPTGGYVVIRIRADNPGVWFMHCHIELHHADGMALMLNESFSLQTPPPAGFPRCGNFNMDDKTDNQRDDRKNDGYAKEEFGITIGILTAFIVILLILLACAVIKIRSVQKSHVTTGNNVHSNNVYLSN